MGLAHSSITSPLARTLHRGLQMLLRRFLAALALSLLLAVSGAASELLDEPSANALEETLRSLRNSDASSLGEIDPRLAPLARSPELTRELYDVAGAVLTDLAKHCSGDPQRMSDALARAKTDPAAFAAMLSPATRTRLAELAAKLPAK